MSDCKPRVRPTPCPEEVGTPPAPEAEPTLVIAPVCNENIELPAEECCPNDNVERGWYNAPLVLSCELPSIGTPVRVPYAVFHSVVSQEAADQAAMDYAVTQLECEYPHYSSQEYTLSCPDGIIPNGAGEFSFVSQTSSPVLRGYSENAGYLSSPPKKFLTCTGSGETSCAFNGYTFLVIRASGSNTVDPATGAITQGLIHSNGNPTPFYDYPQNRAYDGSYGGYDDGCPAFLSSNTGAYKSFRKPIYNSSPIWNASQDDHVLGWSSSGGWVTSTGSVLDTLSNENTEESAIARTAYTTGTNSTASRTLRGAGQFTFTAVRVFTTANLTGLQAGVEYALGYTRTTTNIATSTPVDEPVTLIFTASGASEAIDIGEIPCAPGYYASVSGITVVPVNPVIPGNSITVPAGQFESIVSQEDADAQAEAYAEANLVCD